MEQPQRPTRSCDAEPAYACAAPVSNTSIFARRAALRAPVPLARRIALGLIVGLIGCGGGGDTTAPKPIVVDNTPATIVLAPATPVTLASGLTTTIAASVAAKDGHTITAASVVWASADASVASVSAGVISALKAGSTTISATSGSATATIAVTVTVGAPTQLALRTQPVGAVVGSALATQPVVEIRDAGGNLVTSSTASVTVTIASTDGTLGGSTTVSAVGGVATFSGLTVTGAAGAKTLVFSAAGLTSVTSAPFTMTAPPTPLIVLDANTVSFTAAPGAAMAPKTVTITNGGTQAFTSVALDPVSYDAGQATGWLTATLAGSAPPYTVTLTATAGTLASGTYHATVRVNAVGASNTPASISVTLVISQTNLVYGAATDHVRLLDIGASFTPPVSATANGTPVTLNGVVYTSRATSVATVDAAGKITAVSGGQGWVVASAQGASDSVFVTVPRSATGAVLRADLSVYTKTVGEVTVVTFTLDPRSVAVGAATVAIGYETAPGVFNTISASIPTQTPQPVGANSSFGVFKVSVASATAITTAIPMLRFTFTARNTGAVGWLSFSVLDASDVNGNDITAQFTSTRYPIIVR